MHEGPAIRDLRDSAAVCASRLPVREGGVSCVIKWYSAVALVSHWSDTQSGLYLVPIDYCQATYIIRCAQAEILLYVACAMRMRTRH